MALRRITKELKDIENDPMTHIAVEPMGDDLFELKAMMIGPQYTPYYNGVYRVTMKLPRDYPFKPPRVSFDKSSVPYCINVNEKGGISLREKILKDDWSPALTIRKVLLFIYADCFFGAGFENHNQILMSDRAALFKNNKIEFIRQAWAHNIEIMGDEADDIDFVQFPQISQSKYKEHVDIIRKYAPLPASIIAQIVIPFYGSEEAYCGLFDFIDDDSRRLMIDTALEATNISITNYSTSFPPIDWDEVRQSLQKWETETPQTERFPLYAKTMVGRTITLEVSSDMTIPQMRVALEEASLSSGSFRAPFEANNRLIFAGKSLDTLHTLGDFNITHESTVHIVTSCRCCGG